jgi:ankyrin repeat protein
LDKNVDKSRLKPFPLALYAAQHWVKHAKIEDVSSRVQDAMELFFNPRKPHIVAWVRLHEVNWGLDLKPSNIYVPRPSPRSKAALYFAALCGFSGVADYLITHFEVDIAEFRHSGAPLHAASSLGHIDVVCVLLRHSVDVNAECKSSHNWTPLHVASANGYVKVAQLLLEHGANVNALSTSSSTPLKFASENGHLEVVRLLLSNGANVHIQDLRNLTAFKKATENHHVEIAQLLLEHGAETD